MQLATHVEIENFRSIRKVEADLGALTAFIGSNGSGKSNLFRALNLFFNGLLEPGLPLNFRSDFHKHWRKIGNRFIDITVRFALPSEFQFNKPLRDPLGAIGIKPSETFEIRRRWTPDKLGDGSAADAIYVRYPGGAWTADPLGADDARAAYRFLQLIRFRYIPNHVHPSELLRAESGALQQSLMTALRLRRSRTKATASGGDVDAVLREMAQAAQGLVAPLSEVLAATPGHVQGIEIETPSDWAEVAWSLALKLQSKDARALDAAMHGSGNQSFLMYLLVHFLDTQYQQSFGWHQASIWAVEEPESFLHADLKNQLATFLHESCNRPRFQGLLTTHDLLFSGAADVRHEVSLVDGETRATRYDMSDLADRTLANGVTGYVHPLNLTQPKPTLIVDGPYDVYYLEEAYRRVGRLNPWDIRCLETLDAQSGGSGKTKLKQFLKASAGPLRARPSGSPVVVLLDWEDTESERQAVADLVSSHPTSTAVVWPVDLANPEIGDSFHGIERYLGSALLEDVASGDPTLGITRTVGQPSLFELQPQKRSAVKQKLVTRCRERASADDLAPLSAALGWLDAQIPGRTQQAPLPGA